MADMQTANENKETVQRLQLAIAIAFIVILFLGSIKLSLYSRSEPVSITVLPSVPREDLPMLIMLNLNNPSEENNFLRYELYANERLLGIGQAHLSAKSTEQIVYLLPMAPKLGERITFFVKADSEQGRYEKSFSSPPYPPQVWSSFLQWEFQSLPRTSMRALLLIIQS
jgi:hypothetical protein